MGLIIVGLDGSPRAGAVLAAAVDLAKRYEKQLVLFRSFGVPTGLPEGVWKIDQGSLVEHIRGHAKDYLNDCAREVPAELLAQVRVEVGVPWEAVCAVAKGMNADLIVIGSHGYGGLDRVLGTTAAKIVNHAECSVLVVRGPALTGEKG